MIVAETIARRRIARQVRRLAQRERDHGHRAGVVEFAVMHVRLELYDQLARCVENRHVTLEPRGVAELEALLQEDPPIRDYGLRARERNDRLARILSDLGEPE
jgi:hypothetical protein